MRTFPDLRIRELLFKSSHAQQLLDGGNYEEGRQAFVEVRALARRLGIASGFIDWGLAVACDQLGDLERAYEHIVDAVRHDPLHGGFQGSFNVIMNHLREALADPARDGKDGSTARLYGLLVAAGEADVPSHLAMARHLAATDRGEEALKLLDAVTLLAPASRDAWLQKASVARALGNATLAASCDAEAAAAAQGDAPFGIPAPRGAAC